MKKKNIKKQSGTDWDYLDSSEDDGIDYSDNPPSTDEELERAVLRMPGSSIRISIKLDTDVYNWVISQSSNYQANINEILRMHMEQHRCSRC
jgi:uncharacterized protein (DUF4415 family)